jgi:branched-chain amino acid transport system permease protein
MEPRDVAHISLWSLFGLMLILAIPLGLPTYQISLATEIIIFSLYAISYNLLLGYSGLLSFGHALFFGSGGYATAVALAHFPNIPVWGALGLSLGLTTLIGFATGILLLRHKGAHFALLTLAFNFLFYAIATKWHSVTGGDDGLSVTRPDISFGIFQVSLSGVTSFYFFTLCILGLVILFCWYFTRTAMGQTVLLIRENEERMKFLGYNTNISRLILFTFTGALAGLAGSFYALHFQFISIGAISVDMTTTVLLITFIGGTGTFWGPILGSCVYIYLQDQLSDITDRWPLIMGLIFILMVLFIPGGMSSLYASIKDRILTFRRQKPAAGTER